MMVILNQTILKKLLLTTPHVTTSCFLAIVFAAQQVDETFAITVKFMIGCICRFNDKAKKVSVTCILLHTLYLELPFL